MNYMLRTLVLAALAGLGYLGYEKATSMLDDHQGQILEREARIEQLAGQPEAELAEHPVVHQAAELVVADLAVRTEGTPAQARVPETTRTPRAEAVACPTAISRNARASYAARKPPKGISCGSCSRRKANV